MAYGTFEDSAESARPVELYIFVIGTETYRYTSAEDTVIYSANNYLSRQIDRTSPKASSNESGRQQMEITLPTSDPVAARYVGIVPAERASLEIIRFHRGDAPNGVILWNGRIVSAKFEQQGALCRLFSISSEAALSRPIPGRKYQGLCNHTLYNPLCQVVKASHKYSGNVSAVSGNTITVDGINAAKGAGWAIGGTIDHGNDRRLITEQSGDVLTLQLPFQSTPLNQTVDVYAGCDHKITVCDSKFSNAINFGGFPYVPTKNPFNTGLD